MNTEKQVFNSLFSSNKIDLASQKYELGVIEDSIKVSQNAIKEFESASGIIFSARSKAEPILKNSIALSNSFLNSLTETKKIAKELGIDLPSQLLQEEKFANATISSAKSLLQYLNQLER